jgi:hypothetical protein
MNLGDPTTKSGVGTYIYDAFTTLDGAVYDAPP